MRGATLPILTTRVGLGAANDQGSVRRLQALLYHGGYLSAVDSKHAAGGHWREKSHQALATYLNLPISSSMVYLDPYDPRMYRLLFESSTTISLNPHQRGASAFLALQRFFKFEPITPFLSPHQGGMLVFGVDGVPDLAIVTEDFNLGPWFLPIPAVLNCSTYANLMMSVWRRGNCHAAPYSPDCRESGNTSFAQARYGYKRLNDGKPMVKEIDILLALEEQGEENGLYCLQSASRDRGSPVGHMALLYRSRVYECNYGGPGTRKGFEGTVHDKDLQQWLFRRPDGCFVSGPSSP